MIPPLGMIGEGKPFPPFFIVNPETVTLLEAMYTAHCAPYPLITVLVLFSPIKDTALFRNTLSLYVPASTSILCPSNVSGAAIAS